MDIPPFLVGLSAVFDPHKGSGWPEAIIAILATIGVFAILIIDGDIPAWLVGIFGMIAGYFFSEKAQQYSTGARRGK